MIRLLKIATRTSRLALWQAQWVANVLTKYYPELKIEFVKINTTGDKIVDKPLAEIGGKALFMKELEMAMMAGQADIAVHSMKDVPFALPSGLQIGAMLKRHSPLDAWVSNHYQCFADVPQGGVVGSCSLRRIVQLKQIRKDINFIDLRGNIDTRLNKLDAGKYDGIVLACAGLERLELTERICQRFTPQQVLPAVGQGAIGIEVKADDEAIKTLLTPLVDKNTTLCVNAERAVNEKLQGSCQTSIGVFAELTNDTLTLNAVVGEIKTAKVLRKTLSGDKNEGVLLGDKLADMLLKDGAAKMIKGMI